MLKPAMFDKVLHLSSVDDVKVLYVQTPLPDVGGPADRKVRIAISVSVECTAVVEKNYSVVHTLLKWKGDPPKPVEEEEKIAWIGGVEASANVVNREFRDIEPIALIPVDELGSQRFWKS